MADVLDGTDRTSVSTFGGIQAVAIRVRVHGGAGLAAERRRFSELCPRKSEGNEQLDKGV